MGFLDRFRRNRSQAAGGSGESIHDAIVITALNHVMGVAAEYEYVSRHYGRRGVDWEVKRQELQQNPENGRSYDLLTISLKSGETKTLCFDITQFFGKF
jgi:hypothetical protein